MHDSQGEAAFRSHVVVGFSKPAAHPSDPSPSQRLLLPLPHGLENAASSTSWDERDRPWTCPWGAPSWRPLPSTHSLGLSNRPLWANLPQSPPLYCSPHTGPLSPNPTSLSLNTGSPAAQPHFQALPAGCTARGLTPHTSSLACRIPLYSYQLPHLDPCRVGPNRASLQGAF